MNDLLYENISAIKNKIASLKEYQRLKEINDLLEKDEEVIRLYFDKENKLRLYEDSLKHLPFDNAYVIKLRKDLLASNEVLNNHPLVKEYITLYRYIKSIDHKIEEEIFLPFKKG